MSTTDEIPENPLILVPNTLGGFRGAFYVTYRRAPTEQEVFDAGVRSGLRRAQEARNDSPQ
jgi:hypothetical protein